MLYMGYKFDLRQWVIVHAKDSALSLYACRAPYARIANRPYQLDHLDDLFCHLTNNSV